MYVLLSSFCLPLSSSTATTARRTTSGTILMISGGRQSVCSLHPALWSREAGPRILNSCALQSVPVRRRTCWLIDFIHHAFCFSHHWFIQSLNDTVLFNHFPYANYKLYIVQAYLHGGMLCHLAFRLDQYLWTGIIFTLHDYTYWDSHNDHDFTIISVGLDIGHAALDDSLISILKS